MRVALCAERLSVRLRSRRSPLAGAAAIEASLYLAMLHKSKSFIPVLLNTLHKAEQMTELRFE
jgi:hypothetical protein